jgi:glycosyltransferase involved in cell wall biosynthesis
VGDFGDPLVGGGGLAPAPFWKKLWIGLESAVLKEMDHLCVTTPKTRRLYLDRYPFFPEDRITVVRNGYDPDQFRVRSQPLPPFRMTYAGSIYYPRVAVAPFLEALRRLRSADPERWGNARVRVVGPVIPQAAKAFREAGVELPGEVTFGESLREMAEAHILLLWGNDSGIQIPGKVYYYVGSRRPILCMVNSLDDDLADLLKLYPLAKIATNEPEAIAAALAELRPMAEDQGIGVAGEEFAKECTWQGQFKILDGILAGLGGAT